MKHIEQLRPFFEQNEDIIACVETGFLGPWGEQHSSKIVTQENIKKITEKLLEVVPETRTVNVRKPLWYCATTGVDINNIDKDESKKGTSAYRIGMFNDGYLGSKSDLGSFSNREKALEWLERQATHTLYGGEVVLSSELDKNGNKYHSIEHIQEEMFKTHTSYINREWNYKVIEEWQNDTYEGNDLLYKGKSAYLYVKNHLGYRLVLNECQMPKTVELLNNQTINIKLKNVGAGNVVNEKDAYVILKNDINEYAIQISMDVRNFKSNENYDFDIEIPLEKNIEIGNYDVYLKIVNKNDDVTTNKRTIRFANEGVWNEEIGANKIGNIEIIQNSENEKIIGDVDGDGEITVNDLAKLKLHLIGKEILTNSNSLRTADTDRDGEITINDLARLKLNLIGLLEL